MGERKRTNICTSTPQPCTWRSAGVQLFYRLAPGFRELREQKRLSQGDIERRTGLLRCHISRVENGHKLPSLETLQKFASALEVPLYQIFYDGKGAGGAPRLSSRQLEGLPGGEDKRMAHTRLLKKFSGLWTRLGDSEQQILMKLARRLAGPNRIRQDP